MKYSDEAKLLYGLFVKHYEQNKIHDNSLMLEHEDYKPDVDDEGIKAGLDELQAAGFVNSYKSLIDGSFHIHLRLKCTSLLKNGVKELDTSSTENQQKNSYSIPSVNITVNGNVSGTNVIGAMQDTNINIQTEIDIKKLESLLGQIAGNIEKIGISSDEKKSILNDISSIRSAMKEKDTSKMQMLLTNIKNICSKVAENLIASGIVQQISNLLP